MGMAETSTGRTYVCDVPEDLPDRARWKGLKRIGVAISDTVRGGKSCDEVRYYILSKKLSARSFGAAVRGHWGIENTQPENTPSGGLCAARAARYHRSEGPPGVGCMVRPTPRPWRCPMHPDEPAIAPPRP